MAEEINKAPELEKPKSVAELEKDIKELQAKLADKPNDAAINDQFTLRTKRELAKQPKIKIRIPSSETEKDDVFVCINGYTFQIKRDVEVEVPRSVAKVLEDARYTLYTQKKRADGEGNELIPQTVQRIPFQSRI